MHSRLRVSKAMLELFERVGFGALAATFAFAGTVLAQSNPVRSAGGDSVTVVPGAIYGAGGFHRFILGDNYRDEWTTPIKVPVLDLKSFHGGLTPEKEGGGMQAKNLHL